MFDDSGYTHPEPTLERAKEMQLLALLLKIQIFNDNISSYIIDINIFNV